VNKWEKGGGIDLDRSREFCKQDYPHQPHKYHLHIHFLQRMKEPERFLNGEVIARLISEGHLKDNKDGCAAFHWSRFGGIEYWLIAGYHVDGYRVVVSAWPYLRDREAALQSNRWTNEKLDMVEEFNKQKKRKESEPSLRERWSEYFEWSEAHA